MSGEDRGARQGGAAAERSPGDISVAQFERYLEKLISLIEGNSGRRANYLREESLHAQREVFRKLREHAPRGRRAVLELGSGAGLLAVGLAWAGHDVAGLDYYDERSRNLSEAAGVPVSFSRCQLEADDYDLPPATYDIVVAVDVLEHLKNVSALFTNAWRALREDGLLVLTTPNYGRLNTRLRAVRQIVSPCWPIPLEPYITQRPYIGHVREFSGSELQRAARHFGFEVLDHAYYPAATGKRLPKIWEDRSRGWKTVLQGSWVLQRAAGRLLPSLHSSQIIVAAKRNGGAYLRES